MSPLPDGWVETPLINLVTSKAGNSKLIKGRLQSEPRPGSVPAYSAAGQDVWTETAEWTGSAIVLSAIGARCGKAFLATGSWTAIANTHVIAPSEGVNPRFLWYRLNDERFWIRSGSAQPFVKVKASLEKSIALPPLNEQTRIVAVIDEQLSRLDAAVASIDAATRRLNQLRSVILDEAATSGKWPSAALGDLATGTLIGLDRSRSRQSSESTEGSPYIRMGNIRPDGRMSWDDLTFVALSPSEQERFLVRDGDLLFNTRNSRELVGKTGLARNPPERAVFNNNLMRIRVRDGIDPAFVWVVMNAPNFRTKLDSVKNATTNVAAIYAKNLLPLELPVPPFDEQQRIVADVEQRLSVVESMGYAIENAKRRRATLRRSILEHAFGGQLVPQEPTDEPAAAILERIAKKRGTAEPKRGKKGHRE